MYQSHVVAGAMSMSSYLANTKQTQRYYCELFVLFSFVLNSFHLIETLLVYFGFHFLVFSCWVLFCFVFVRGG